MSVAGLGFEASDALLDLNRVWCSVEPADHCHPTCIEQRRHPWRITELSGQPRRLFHKRAVSINLLHSRQFILVDRIWDARKGSDFRSWRRFLDDRLRALVIRLEDWHLGLSYDALFW